MQPAECGSVIMGMRLVYPLSFRRRSGFTIVELLIVILIILILAALVVWAFVKIREVVRSLGRLDSAPPPPAQAPAGT